MNTVQVLTFALFVFSIAGLFQQIQAAGEKEYQYLKVLNGILFVFLDVEKRVEKIDRGPCIRNIKF